MFAKRAIFVVVSQSEASTQELDLDPYTTEDTPEWAILSMHLLQGAPVM